MNMFTCFVILAVVSQLTVVNGDVDTAPGLPSMSVKIPGKVIVGMLNSITGGEMSQWTGRCNLILQRWEVEYLQLLMEQVDTINADASILNGTQLGFVNYDFCGRDMFAAAQSTHFLPPSEVNDTRLVAVICCTSTPVASMVSSFLTAYEIPVLSYSATGDILSNKGIHEFFMRTMPPDTAQVAAVMSIVRHFNWSYVAALYIEGTWGENEMARFEEMADQEDQRVCIGYSKKIMQTISGQMMPSVVDDLLSIPEITVVVFFMYDAQAVELFRELKKRGITDRYVWVSTDGWWQNLDTIPAELHDVAAGAFVINTITHMDVSQLKFLQDPYNGFDPRNPWLHKYWEMRMSCQWNVSCSRDNLTRLPDALRKPVSSTIGEVLDAFGTVVRGLQAYLPTVDYDLSRFSSRDYLHAMKNVHFDGFTGRVQYDQNGDVLGILGLIHGVRSGNKYVNVMAGTYTGIVNGTLNIDSSKIMWHGEPRYPKPESICSRPCGSGYMRIQRALICCWSCHKCRSNEVTNHNATECIECPEFSWPDAEQVNCIPIPYTYVHYDDPLGVFLVAAAVSASIVTLIVVVVFIRNNSNRLIRSSCREASYLMLLGMLADFLLLLVLAGTPSDGRCYVFRFGFHLTCTMMYGPIAIKIIKIFRIFEAGKKSKEAPKFISPGAQLAVIGALILVEAAIILASLFVSPAGASRYMASKDEPTVDITCDETVLSMCMNLVFNFLLIVCCACLAFASRRLPDNFNESSQVAFSVMTTIILWIAFLPSWLTSVTAARKVLMMALAMLLNGLVNLIGLFFPKIYAVYFVVPPTKKPGQPAFAQAHKPQAVANGSSSNGTSGTNPVDPSKI